MKKRRITWLLAALATLGTANGMPVATRVQGSAEVCAIVWLSETNREQRSDCPHRILLVRTFVWTLATAWMDRALAVDPWLLRNLFGKTKDASIARLVSALFFDCGCRVSDSTTPYETRTVEEETILSGKI